MYGPADEQESIATIHAALDAGVNLIDTGDFYGMGHNEMLVGRAIKGRRREQVMVSVKFGALRAPGGAWTGVDCRPAALKNFAAYSLTRLGVDYIDVYRPARLDPAVPIEDTIGAIADLVRAGYVRHIGLSEVGAETIRRAARVHTICDLQIEYSLISRGPEAHIFPALEELGIAATVYGVLSRGLLSGSTPAEVGDFRTHFPRFKGENFERNQRLVEKLRAMAEGMGITAPQLAIAWALAKGRFVIPVLGSRTRAQLKEALGAFSVELTAADAARIEGAIRADEAAGTRYDARQMQMLDSEKPQG